MSSDLTRFDRSRASSPLTGSPRTPGPGSSKQQRVVVQVPIERIGAERHAPKPSPGSRTRNPGDVIASTIDRVKRYQETLLNEETTAAVRQQTQRKLLTALRRMGRRIAIERDKDCSAALVNAMRGVERAFPSGTTDPHTLFRSLIELQRTLDTVRVVLDPDYMLSRPLSGATHAGKPPVPRDISTNGECASANAPLDQPAIKRPKSAARTLAPVSARDAVSQSRQSPNRDPTLRKIHGKAQTFVLSAIDRQLPLDVGFIDMEPFLGSLSDDLTEIRKQTDRIDGRGGNAIDSIAELFEGLIQRASERDDDARVTGLLETFDELCKALDRVASQQHKAKPSVLKQMASFSPFKHRK